MYSDVYDKYFQVVDKKYYKVNSTYVAPLLTILERIRQKDYAAKDVSVADLQLLFYAQANIRADDVPMYEQLFQELSEMDISKDLATEFFTKHMDKARAATIAAFALDVAEDKSKFEDLMTLMEESKAKEKIEISYVSDNLQSLVNATIAGPGVSFRLKFLCEAIGPLRGGDFGFVFARPETGKTTFLASEGTYIADQLVTKNKDFLWFNNEEKGEKVKIRCYQAAFGITKEELLGDLPRWNTAWREKYKGRFKMVDDAVISRYTIERVMKQNNPGFVVIDQIDKITGFQADREDIYLGRIYQWARELAKTYDCPVLGICQAGASGEGKLYMNMDDVSQSKTSKQAEADFIVAIGKDHDRPEYVRGLHIIKNKCSGDENTVEEYRHGKMAVLIDPPIARYVMQGE